MILALITSTTHRAALEPTQLLTDLASPEGRQSGLLHNSAVKREHLITLHQRLIKRLIGRLPTQLMQKVDLCLKVSLGI